MYPLYCQLRQLLAPCYLHIYENQKSKLLKHSKPKPKILKSKSQIYWKNHVKKKMFSPQLKQKSPNLKRKNNQNKANNSPIL